MKFLVIGTIVRDIIRSFDGRTSRSNGGLCYTINSLLSIAEKDDRIVPVSFAGRDFYEEITDYYKGYEQIVTDGLVLCDQLNNTVELDYINPAERQEKSLHPFPSLPFTAVENFLDADAVIINMISGWDLELPVLKNIRDKFPGVISIDLHSLNMGRQNNGLRYFRPVSKIESWMEYADIVQANAKEFENIGGNLKQPQIFLSQSCFKDGNIFNLTLGSEGSSSYYYNKNELQQYNALPVENLQINDPTGCGDVYLAGFLYNYIKTKNLQGAADNANRIAAFSGTLNGLPDPDILRDKLRKNV